jgi:hypothetical protein
MKTRMMRVGLAVGVFSMAMTGVAVANQSGNSAINCAGFGNPGQTFQSFNAAGPDHQQTPPQLDAGLVGLSVGAANRAFCVNPSDTHP